VLVKLRNAQSGAGWGILKPKAVFFDPADRRRQFRLSAMVILSGILLNGAVGRAAPLSGAIQKDQIALPQRAMVQKIAVFGKDDRTRPPKRLRRLRESLGLLFNNTTATACSAFCVAKDIVATASHCLFRVNTNAAPHMSQFVFARRYNEITQQSPIAGGRAAAGQNVMVGSTALSVRPPIDATQDWAFVRLARPICAKAVLPVRAITSATLIKQSKARRIFQLAYHRDYANWQLAYSKPCLINKNFKTASWNTIRRDFRHADQLILHTCDTGGASSGSPILLDNPGGAQVIGINVGTYIQSNALLRNGKVTRRYKANAVANTAVSAIAFAKQLTLFREAKILRTTAAINELQTQLKRHSLYVAKIDGVYGRLTRSAIVAFERNLGLPVTGLASQENLARIRATPTLLPPVAATAGRLHNSDSRF